MPNRLLVAAMLCSAALLCRAAPPQTIAPLDFAAARTMAHARADSIKAEDAETSRREHEAQSARSLHGPKVVLDAKQVWGSKSVDIGPINLGSMMPPQLGPILGSSLDDTSLSYRDDLDGPRAVLSLEMPLYTGGAITARVNPGSCATSSTPSLRRNTLPCSLRARS